MEFFLINKEIHKSQSSILSRYLIFLYYRKIYSIDSVECRSGSDFYACVAIKERINIKKSCINIIFYFSLIHPFYCFFGD